jgi:galactokinase
MIKPPDLAESFRRLFGNRPRVYRAPGRVNLIGEHTDYNQGLVMPAAIDFYTWIALAPRADRRLVIRSENFAETSELDLERPPAQGRGHWSDYPFGVALKLEQAGRRLRGANVLVIGEVPLGAGLSSSAAIEVATGFALLESSELAVDRLVLAKLCQRAENEFVGTRCGLMDQFTSCFGKAGSALLLDCRSLEVEFLPLPPGVKLVVCNTMVKHELAASEYNTRRAECEEAVRLLAKEFPGVRSLRDVTCSEIEQSKLPVLIKRRARHVTSENQRVIDAAVALRNHDLKSFGALMRESHQSLRDDYEVSCAELDQMVEIAGRIEGVIGARMTGGGFGGCTVNLVESEAVEQFSQTIAVRYAQATGSRPEIYICKAAQGAERVELSV